MATTPEKPIKIVTVQYTDAAAGQSTQLQVINSTAGNVGEIQFKGPTGNFAASNSLVWTSSPTSGNTLQIRGNIRVTGTITSNIVGNPSAFKIIGGNAGEVLTTNGNGYLYWSNVVTVSYGNDDVANYLPTYTGTLKASEANLGNSIRGNFFIGSGNNLSNIQGANVNGAVNLATYATTANSVAVANVTGIGNIATINTDGNASNILYGNGVFAAKPETAAGNYISQGGYTLEVNTDGSLSLPGYSKIDTATDGGTVTIYPNTSDLDYGIKMFISYDNDVHIESANVSKGIALGKSYGSGAHVRIVGNVAYGDDSVGDIVVQPQNYSGGAQKTFRFDTQGRLTFPDGTVQTTAYTTPQQYGYIDQFVHTSNDNVDMEAVAMDDGGNSYVSYSFYDDNQGRMRGGIIKLDNTGSTQWNVTLQSSNTDGQYPKITSLEHVDIAGTKFLVTIGYYYDNIVGKDRGFMWFISPDDGNVGTMFDIETRGDVPVTLSDAVFGLDNSSQPFAVIVGDTYNEMLQKTFTPLAGSGVDKLVVSWSEFNASGVQPGEWIYYNTGGSYGIRLNSFDTVATLTGTGDGLYLQVSINQNGTYSILRANGWSGVIYGWGNPVNVKVLGSNLGGVDGVNDLTFDLDTTALSNNSNNVAGWASNIQGTAISDVVGFGWGGKDWSTEIGNNLTFDYQLNRQAYIARLGSNNWAKSVGGSEYERLSTVVVDNNGNSYVGGYYWNGNKASVVIKFDIDGNQQWAVHIDSPNNTGNDVTSIDLVTDGNLIAVDEEGFITKINSSNGNIIWQVRVDPNNDISWDSQFKGTATPDGNYIITNYEDNDYTLYVMCVSGTDGSELWSKRITRSFAGSNGEIYPQDDFDAQYIDCNATSVTIAASTYLYFNGNSTNAGLVINIPVNGENTDGVYGQYIIESANPGWNTETTTSTSATINLGTSPVTLDDISPTRTINTFNATETIIGEEPGPGLGNIAFDGSRLSSPATGSGDFPNGVITLAPGNGSDSNYADNGQFINIYPTGAYDAPHIHVAPGTGTNGTGDLILGVDNYHVDVNHDGNIYIKTNNQNYNWVFANDGNLILSSYNNLRKSIRGTTELIQGDPFPNMSTPTPGVKWTASSASVVGAKLTVRVESNNNTNTEMFDILIAKEYPNGNVSYSINNRIKTNNSVADTTITVDIDGSNNLTVSLASAVNSYVTYSATEFNHTFD